MAIPEHDNFGRKPSVKDRLGARIPINKVLIQKAPILQKAPIRTEGINNKYVSSNSGSRKLKIGPAALGMVKKVLVPPPSKFMEEDKKPYIPTFKRPEEDPNYASCSKKLPCKFWIGPGSCRNGDSCRFAHDDVPMEAGLAKVCRFWISGSCKYGDGCKFSHSQNNSNNGSNYFLENNGFDQPKNAVVVPSRVQSPLDPPINVQCSFDQPKNVVQSLMVEGKVPGFAPAKLLQAHKSGITGMAYDEKTKLLFTADEANMLCAWETGSGECVSRAGMEGIEGKVSCMTSQAGWLFVGVGNTVRAWHLETNGHQDLKTTGGIVNALAADKQTGLLIAGTQDGKLACWNGTTGFNLVPFFQEGHADSVTSLAVAGGRLYSGSRDSKLKVWDLTTGKCLMCPVGGHTGAVTGLLCWESYLLSCSLDGSVKVWAASAEQGGNLEVTFTLPRGVYGDLQGFTGFSDSNGPLLACLYQGGLTVLELPSFEERGVFVKGGAACAVVSSLESPGFICSGEKGGDVKQWSCCQG